MNIKSKIAVALLSAVCMTAGALGVSACASEKDCQHSDKSLAKDENGHFYFCNDCQDTLESEKHKDGDGDGLCDVCGWVMDEVAAIHLVKDGLCYRKAKLSGSEELWLERTQTLVGYNEQSLVIPSQINGIPVTQIRAKAFYGMASLRSVTLPDGLVEIGERAFEGCAGLESIVLPSSVKNVMGYAFKDCKMLASVTLNEGLEKMYGSIFDGCDKLTQIEIPASVTQLTSLGTAAFEKITVSAGNANFCDVDGVLYDKAKTKIIQVPINLKGAVTIPSGITRIGSQFANRQFLTKIILPDSVEEIDANAFENCPRLYEANVPDKVKELKSGTFRYCVSLYKISLGKGLEKVSGDAFYDCGKLIEMCNNSEVDVKLSSVKNVYSDKEGESAIKTDKDGFVYLNDSEYDDTAYLLSYTGSGSNVTVPEKFDGRRYYVYRYAFAYNDSLESVSFPDTVLEFSYNVFTGCDNLKKLEIEENSQYIGKGNCIIDKITGSVVAACKDSVIPTDGSVRRLISWAYSGNGWLTEIEIPEGVTTITEGTFKNCVNLKSVKLPSSLTSVAADAFAGCTALESITVAENNSVYSSEGGILYNKDKTQIVCAPKGLKGEITLSDGLTFIGKEAFSQCKNITAVTLPDSVTGIENWAFSNCWALKRVTLGGKVTYLGMGAFNTCIDLTEINLPEGLIAIGDWAFGQCRNLLSITIPQSVTEIREGAFSACDRLVEVYNLSSLSLDGLITKSSNNDSPVKIIHKSADEASMLHTADGFTFYENGNTVILVAYSGEGNCVQLPENYNGKNYSIGAYAFYGCGRPLSGMTGWYYLDYLVIPSGVVSVDERFNEAMRIGAIYFGGNRQDWDRLRQNSYYSNYSPIDYIDNYYLYSQTKPNGDDYNQHGYYWHKDSDGKILFWW